MDCVWILGSPAEDSCAPSMAFKGHQIWRSHVRRDGSNLNKTLCPRALEPHNNHSTILGRYLAEGNSRKGWSWLLGFFVCSFVFFCCCCCWFFLLIQQNRGLGQNCSINEDLNFWNIWVYELKKFNSASGNITNRKLELISESSAVTIPISHRLTMATISFVHTLAVNYCSISRLLIPEAHLKGQLLCETSHSRGRRNESESWPKLTISLRRTWYVSHLFIFHWPKQVTWSSATSRG